MLKFSQNPQTGQLDVVQEPPFVDLSYADTCTQPDPCPGCGNCLLCDAKCTCVFRQLDGCKQTDLCYKEGHCLWPYHCPVVKEN